MPVDPPHTLPNRFVAIWNPPPTIWSPTGAGPTVNISGYWSFWTVWTTPGDDSTAVDTSSSGNDFKISAPGFGVIQHDAGHTYSDGTHHGITAEFPFTPEVEAELCAALTS